MLYLYAILEKWVIEDGNYPLLNKNDKINIAFYIESYEFEIIKYEKYFFEQTEYSEYNFCGKIIYKHSDLFVIDTGIFKFYIESEKSFKVGTYINGTGKLLIDYYAWAENISKYKNCPYIFYNVMVKKLFSVKIPEKYINRNNGVISYPSSIKSNEINENDIKEIEKMEGDHNIFGYYLMELEEINENINMTFCNL